MTDFHLRELERRWKETGTVQDEAAWLLQRVRVGDLDQSRLEGAARIGDKAARLALGATEPGDGSEISEVVGHLTEEERSLLAVLAASHVLPAWSREHPSEETPKRAILLAREWLLQGGDQSAAAESADRADQLALECRVGGEYTPAGWAAHTAASVIDAYLPEVLGSAQRAAGSSSAEEQRWQRERISDLLLGRPLGDS